MTVYARLAGILLLAPALAFAAPLPCASGTLDTFVALGNTGCTINNTVFRNFQYRPGGSPITEKDVIVSVLEGPLLFIPGPADPQLPAIGLGFSTFPKSWRARAGGIASSVTPRISYTVVPDGDIRGFEVTMGAADFTGSPAGFGFVTVNGELCLNGSSTACPANFHRTVTTFFLSSGLTQPFAPTRFARTPRTIQVENLINVSAYVADFTSAFPNTIQNLFLTP